MKGKFITTQIRITCLASQRSKKITRGASSKWDERKNDMAGENKKRVILSSAEEFGQVA